LPISPAAIIRRTCDQFILPFPRRIDPWGQL